ncbi:MAG: hypothetical protein AAF481_14845 [Acidobacteriota bacterium]
MKASGPVILVALLSGAASAAGEGSLQGTERVRLDCRSDLQRRDLTLFANGTVRLKEGPPGEEKMALGEVSPSEVEEYLRLLSEVETSEAAIGTAGPGGDWVDRCELTLNLPEREEESFEFQRFGSQSLGLNRLVSIVETLADQLGPVRGEDRLPLDYSPAVGDILRREDGHRFRVISFTADGKGVELRGLDIPLVLYIEPKKLPSQFVAVEARR